MICVEMEDALPLWIALDHVTWTPNAWQLSRTLFLRARVRPIAACSPCPEDTFCFLGDFSMFSLPATALRVCTLVLRTTSFIFSSEASASAFVRASANAFSSSLATRSAVLTVRWSSVDSVGCSTRALTNSECKTSICFISFPTIILLSPIPTDMVCCCCNPLLSGARRRMALRLFGVLERTPKLPIFLALFRGDIVPFRPVLALRYVSHSSGTCSGR